MVKECGCLKQRPELGATRSVLQICLFTWKPACNNFYQVLRKRNEQKGTDLIKQVKRGKGEREERRKVNGGGGSIGGSGGRKR